MRSELYVFSTETIADSSSTQGKLRRLFGCGLQPARHTISGELALQNLYCYQSNYLLSYTLKDQSLSLRHNYKLSCAPLSLTTHPLQLILACGFKLCVKLYVPCESQLVELRVIHRLNSFVKFLQDGELVVGYSSNSVTYQLEMYRAVYSLEPVVIPLTTKYPLVEINDYERRLLMMRTAHSIHLLDRWNNWKRAELHSRLVIATALYQSTNKTLVCSYQTGELKYYRYRDDAFTELQSINLAKINGYVSCLRFD